MKHGLFIVLEGIDGSGTSTQCKLVTKQLRLMERSVYSTREPSDGKIGKLIRGIIRDDGKNNKPSWMCMTLLFSADRLEHVDKVICPEICNGTHVVCDRYYHSTLAYQFLSSDTGGLNWMDWIKTVGQFSTVPNLTFVLDIDAREASKRIGNRRNPKDIYESLEFQEKLSNFYSTIEEHFPQEKIIHVDGSQDVGSVTNEILQHISKYIEEQEK